MKITVNDIPPSNNKYMGNSHSFRVYSQKKEEWHWKIKAAVREHPERPYERAKVTLTYFFKDARRRDPDNYSGKFILDALTKEGIITDDNFDVIDLLVKKGGVDKNNPRTEIEVEECKDDKN